MAQQIMGATSQKGWEPQLYTKAIFDKRGKNFPAILALQNGPFYNFGLLAYLNVFKWFTYMSSNDMLYFKARTVENSIDDTSL